MIKPEKAKRIELLKKDFEENPVIVLVDLFKMPSKELQEIRKMLRGKAKVRMVKKVVIQRALNESTKENIKGLDNHLPSQPAIALTEMGAFKFFSFVDGIKFKTYAKEGDIAGEDIWISAGPTDLMAGPVISELQAAGVPAKIDAGKISIRKDVCIVKNGEAINAAKANIMRKLKIAPMDVSLKVVAIFDNGNIYTKDTLEMTKMFPVMLSTAFNNALNLSVFITFPTKENIRHLIAKAARAANAISGLAVKGGKTQEPSVEEAEGTSAAEKHVEEKNEDSNDGGNEDVVTKNKEEAKEEHGGAE